MDLKHTKLNYGYLSLLDDLPSSSRLDPKRDPPSAMYHHDARALESPSERLQNSSC